MSKTPASLLDRLRTSKEQADWARFVRLYSPLLYYWARRMGLTGQDADDLIQDIFTLLLEKLPEFRYDPSRSFRSWLRTVTLNKWREQERRKALLPVKQGDDALPDLASPDAHEVFERETYHASLFHRALSLIRDDFEARSWKAFEEHGLKGRPAAEVATELGLSEGAVYAVKCRVLARVRKELAGLLD